MLAVLLFVIALNYKLAYALFHKKAFLFQKDDYFKYSSLIDSVVVKDGKLIPLLYGALYVIRRLLIGLILVVLRFFPLA